MSLQTKLTSEAAVHEIVKDLNQEARSAGPKVLHVRTIVGQLVRNANDLSERGRQVLSANIKQLGDLVNAVDDRFYDHREKLDDLLELIERQDMVSGTWTQMAALHEQATADGLPTGTAGLNVPELVAPQERMPETARESSLSSLYVDQPAVGTQERVNMTIWSKWNLVVRSKPF